MRLTRVETIMVATKHGDTSSSHIAQAGKQTCLEINHNLLLSLHLSLKATVERELIKTWPRGRYHLRREVMALDSQSRIWDLQMQRDRLAEMTSRLMVKTSIETHGIVLVVTSTCVTSQSMQKCEMANLKRGTKV